ncbi:MAG TPA: hypothetical protein VGM08_03770 [Candidatus Saccharimonadales bacterium]|jgi:hypothetical protein
MGHSDNKKSLRSLLFRASAVLTLAGLVIAGLLNAGQAFAATMTHVTVLETNMQTSGQSALIVSFVAGASDASGSVVINMGSAVSAVLAAPNVSTSYNSVSCATITGASTGLPGTLTSSGNTSPSITVSGAGALTLGTSYCFVVGTFAAQTAVTNSSSANAYAVTLTDGSDTGSGSVDVISSDQVSVSATVPASFTMSIANTADNFSANLSSASVGSTSGDNITINTNSSHGWFVWASDANIGLKSPTAGSSGYTIASGNSNGPVAAGTNTTLSSGHEGYVLGISSGNITQGSGSGGTTSAATAFASSGTGNGAGLNTTPAIIASSTGTANAAIIKPVQYAGISGITPAGTDYTDTITYIGAGSF